MKHWKVEINFEAWDERDAARMIRLMLVPVDAERRLLFATTAEETTEMVDESRPAAVRPSEELAESSPAERAAMDAVARGVWEEC